MHVVADDCALPRDKGITGRRGVAGTILVAKVAGAAAEAGLSLEEVGGHARISATVVSSTHVSPTCPGRIPIPPVGCEVCDSAIVDHLGEIVSASLMVLAMNDG